MKTKYFFVLLVACFMGTQVMSAQHHENDKRQPRKRMTIEQMTDMQADKIIGDLGLDDKTAAKFKDVYAKYMKEMNDLRKEGMDFRMRGRIQKGDTLAKMKMQVEKVYNKGMMNQGKFHKEMNRRAGMKKPDYKK